LVSVSLFKELLGAIAFEELSELFEHDANNNKIVRRIMILILSISFLNLLN